MARQIQPTPMLRGAEAERFLTRMERDETRTTTRVECRGIRDAFRIVQNDSAWHATEQHRG